jgi:hypothetical protein
MPTSMTLIPPQTKSLSKRVAQNMDYVKAKSGAFLYPETFALQQPMPMQMDSDVPRGKLQLQRTQKMAMKKYMDALGKTWGGSLRKNLVTKTTTGVIPLTWKQVTTYVTPNLTETSRQMKKVRDYVNTVRPKPTLPLYKSKKAMDIYNQKLADYMTEFNVVLGKEPSSLQIIKKAWQISKTPDEKVRGKQVRKIFLDLAMKHAPPTQV